MIKLPVLMEVEVYFPRGSSSAIGEGELHTIVFLSVWTILSIERK